MQLISPKFAQSDDGKAVVTLRPMRLKYNINSNRSMPKVIQELLNLDIFLRSAKNLQAIIRAAIKRYRLGWVGLSKLTTEHVHNIATAFSKAIISLQFELPKREVNETFWLAGQLKTFVAIIICYAKANFLDIADLNQATFKHLLPLFPSKNEYFLCFEFNHIFVASNENRFGWTEQEITLLLSVINKQEPGNTWKQYSYELFMKSEGKLYKSPEACRDKWQNHLNPSLRKEGWTLKEDLTMLKAVERYGTRWALISKKLHGSRTQHMIKNRFNSLCLKLSSHQKKQPKEQLVEILLNRVTKNIDFQQISAHQISIDEQFVTESQEENHDQSTDSHKEKQTEETAKETLQEQSNSLQEEDYKTIDELMNDINLRSYGECYPYIRAIDDAWMEIIEQDQEQNILDFYD